MNDVIQIEQKQVPFYDHTVLAVLVQDTNGKENIYIPLKALTESLGLDWSAQRQRIKRNKELDRSCSMVIITTKRGKRKALALPISHLNGFLFKIDTDRVKVELRPLLEQYQQKCYEILFDAFNSIESMVRFYKSIGLDDGWIDRRLNKHMSSTLLNDVWLIHGVPIEKHPELRDIISKGTFGITTNEHRQIKQLPNSANLPDNMSRVELLISSYADEIAIALSEETNPSSYDENELIASRAGKAGKTIKDNFESETGKKVLTSKNNLGDGSNR